MRRGNAKMQEIDDNMGEGRRLKNEYKNERVYDNKKKCKRGKGKKLKSNKRKGEQEILKQNLS